MGAPLSSASSRQRCASCFGRQADKKKRGFHLDSLAPPSSSLSLCLSFTQSLPSSPSAEQQQECFVTLGPAVCLSVCLNDENTNQAAGFFQGRTNWQRKTEGGKEGRKAERRKAMRDVSMSDSLNWVDFTAVGISEEVFLTAPEIQLEEWKQIKHKLLKISSSSSQHATEPD